MISEQDTINSQELQGGSTSSAAFDGKSEVGPQRVTVGPVMKWYIVVSCLYIGAFLLLIGGLIPVGAVADYYAIESVIEILSLCISAIALIVIGAFASRKGVNWWFVFLAGLAPGFMITYGWISVYAGLSVIKRGDMTKELKKNILRLTPIVIVLTLLLAKNIVEG